MQYLVSELISSNLTVIALFKLIYDIYLSQVLYLKSYESHFLAFFYF